MRHQEKLVRFRFIMDEIKANKGDLPKGRLDVYIETLAEWLDYLHTWVNAGQDWRKRIKE